MALSALPPSARDFLVYQRLVVDGVSTRTVAGELHVSQTRVRQIALRVTQWLVETLTAADSDLSDEAQLRLGQHIAADRLERLYLATNRAWEETSQVKFANLCIRIMAAQSKLPAFPGTLEALAADAILGPLPDDTSSLYTTEFSSFIPHPSSLPTPPSLRACSPPTTNSPVAQKKPTTPPAATPTAPKPSNDLPPITHAARSAFFSPAHSPESIAVVRGSPDPAPAAMRPVVRGSPDPAPAAMRGSPDPAPILELKITPEKLGFTTQKSLSRKDRRRLRRLAIAKK